MAANRGLAMALASGFLLAILFPNLTGVNAPFLAPFALVPLLIAAAGEARPLRRLLLGEAAGIVYWLAICYWIQYVLAQHGGVGEAGGWASFLLFCLLKSIHLGVFALAAGALARTWWAAPAIAALWVAIERTHGPAGFAWLALGNAGMDWPLAPRLAPFTGVYGISFLFALFAAVAAQAIRRRPRRELAWLALALPIALLPPLPAAAHQTAASAVVVQPNIPDTADWTEALLASTVDRMATMSLEQARSAGASPPAIVVWPEVPAPFYYFNDTRFRDAAATLARLTGAPFLFGTVGRTPEGMPLNSAVLLDRAGNYVERYDKMFLVPFGEFIPPGFGWIHRITQEVGDYVPGERISVFRLDERRLAAFICYESAFPHLVRRFTAAGAGVLFNLSNDGYFGRSAARRQHLLLVRMRAAENRRWIVRATNDGITASVDPAGNIAASLEPYQSAAGRVPFAWERDQTFYVRHGDWFAWGCAPLALAGLLLATTRFGVRPK
jgi:apolipoprotein N-acyltransferase